MLINSQFINFYFAISNEIKNSVENTNIHNFDSSFWYMVVKAGLSVVLYSVLESYITKHTHTVTGIRHPDSTPAKIVLYCE